MENLKAASGQMSSIEIAELTGKSHANLLRDIRNMEPAWEKISGIKFDLANYVDDQRKQRPMYNLSKTECLYVATKFNDEARARLVIRWEQLESEKQPTKLPSIVELAQAVIDAEHQKQKLLAEISIKDHDLVLANGVIKEQAPKVAFVEKVLQSTATYTMTQIAKELDFRSAEHLSKELSSKGVIYKQSGSWLLYAKHQGNGYAETRTHQYFNKEGEARTSAYLVWTEKGRRFIHSMLNQKLFSIQLSNLS